MKCPICNAEMKSTIDYSDHIIMESTDICEACGRYQEHFVTGDYEIGIKSPNNEWIVWQWNYSMLFTSSYDEIKVEIEEAVAHAIRG